MAKGGSWSMKELQQALRMKRQGVPYADIASTLGRKVEAIEAKLKGYGKIPAIVPIARSGEKPASAAEGQTRRNVACHRDLTGAICGDPPLGYSALDGKGGISRDLSRNT
jgi:hypothetical protein